LLPFNYSFLFYTAKHYPCGKKNKASLFPKIRFLKQKGRFSGKLQLGLAVFSWNIPLFSRMKKDFFLIHPIFLFP